MSPNPQKTPTKTEKAFSEILSFSYDRDNYIEVLWSNIKSDAKSQYQKASTSDMMDFGMPYDYGSIMHYSVYQGSINSYSPCFRVLRSYDEASIGQRKYFSRSDIRKLNLLYKCGQTPGGDSDDSDEPNVPRPQPFPVDDGWESTGITCENGCCCQCHCKSIMCTCNCPCTCSRTLETKFTCNCQCNVMTFVPSLFSYQSIPQAYVIL